MSHRHTQTHCPSSPEPACKCIMHSMYRVCKSLTSEVFNKREGKHGYLVKAWALWNLEVLWEVRWKWCVCSTGWGAAGQRGQLLCAKPSTRSPAASLFLSYTLVEGGGLNWAAKGAAKIHHHARKVAEVNVPVVGVSCCTFTSEWG